MAQKKDKKNVVYIGVRGGPWDKQQFRFDRALPNGKPLDIDKELRLQGDDSGKYVLFNREGIRWFQWVTSPSASVGSNR